MLRSSMQGGMCDWKRTVDAMRGAKRARDGSALQEIKARIVQGMEVRYTGKTR
ncbi:hypothetical protein HBI56_096650 [Parastagonospora nodorum]|nr:hypothetical protein HBH50_007980 [Parastagonospora nodorum]KAH4095905.1 hypothetical protein HBH48_049810 [Parastagonospora nodorum]KAH4120624.1 hypothetical protein HBH47_110670 [Parastagonospora nodorum]KAH4197656.1 hypothetical protein HBH42_060270 [Parastagonospora nodorum]KAH4215087.1 hypothetical protein HBI95_016750 [Parastagonospora nodorum]